MNSKHVTHKTNKRNSFSLQIEKEKHIVVWQRVATLEALLKSIFPLMFSQNLCSFSV